MPTRIVLREPSPFADTEQPDPESDPRPRRRGIESLDLNDAERGGGGRGAPGNPRDDGGDSDGRHTGQDDQSWRGAMADRLTGDPFLRRQNHRTSWSRRNKSAASPSPTSAAGTGEATHRHLSRTDISASPRLVGYMYMMISGLVCALSALWFEREGMPGIAVGTPRPEPYSSSISNGGGVGGGDARRYLLFAPPVVSRGDADRGGRAVEDEGGLVYDPWAESMDEGVSGSAQFEPVVGRSLQEEEGPAANASLTNSTTNDTSVPARNATDLPSELPSVAPADGPTLAPLSDRPSSVPSLPPIEATASPTSVPSLSPSTDVRPLPDAGIISNETASVSPSYYRSPSTSLSPTSAPPTNGPTRKNLDEILPPRVSDGSEAPTTEPALSLVPSSVPTLSTAPSGALSSVPTPENQKWLGAVAMWKVWGSISVPAFASVLGFFIVLVHFDKQFFPKTWRSIFHDGSKGERNLLIFLLFLWIFILYVCTSMNSLGYLQPNVFFSSWIGFFSVVLTYGLWRTGADKPSIITRIKNHPRQTTLNWVWLLLFSFAVLIISIEVRYTSYEKNETVLGMKVGSVTRREWNAFVLTPAVTVVISAMAPLLSHRTTRPGTRRWVQVTWNITEGVLLLLLTGLWSYSLLMFTGPTGIVNGINNAYCGVWGTFLCAVFAMGTWFRQGLDQ